MRYVCDVPILLQVIFINSDEGVQMSLKQLVDEMISGIFYKYVRNSVLSAVSLIKLSSSTVKCGW